MLRTNSVFCAIKISMPETPENLNDTNKTPAARKLPGLAKMRLRVRPIDIVAFIVFTIVVILLATTLIGKLSLKSEVASAKPTADRVIFDIAKQDATDAHSLANKKFQSQYSVAELQAHFKPISEIYAKTPPVVVMQNVSDNSKAQNAAFIYEYTRLKVPFYIRVDVSKVHGSSTWQLVGLTTNNDESQLLPSN